MFSHKKAQKAQKKKAQKEEQMILTHAVRLFGDAVLSLAYFSNLAAALTHYGTTPAPIYFGAGYTTQRTWWTLGLITSMITITIWTVVGFAWWKVLKLW